MKQFETHCRRCGQKILMTWDDGHGRWVPCDPEIRKYVPGGGPFTYVDINGNIRHGKRTYSGNAAGEWGYQRHRADCASARRTAG